MRLSSDQRWGQVALYYLIACLLLTPCSLSGNHAAAQDRDQTEAQLLAVNEAIADVNDWLESATQDQSQQQQALREVELAWSQASRTVSEIENQVAQSQSRLADLQQQRQSQARQLQEQEDVLNRLVRAAYRNAEQGLLKTLLNEEAPGDGSRRLYYLRALGDYQAQRIARYQASLDSLEILDTQLAAELDALTQQQQRQAVESARLLQLRTGREQALAALETDITNRSAELEELEVNQARLQELLQEIARAMEGIRSFADVPPITERRGELLTPVNGEVVSRFGASYGGGSLTRQGIVIAAQEGSTVRATHAGYVAFADWLRGAGLLVVLDHGAGYVSLYGGNQALAVAAGQWVDGGAVIATSGRGTDSTGPGLYFELRFQGQALDPQAWLPANQ